MNATDIAALAALIVAALAFFVAFAQVVQQYLSSSAALRLCDKNVYGELPGRGRRVWLNSQFRFRVIYTLPRIQLQRGLWESQSDDETHLHLLSSAIKLNRAPRSSMEKVAIALAKKFKIRWDRIPRIPPGFVWSFWSGLETKLESESITSADIPFDDTSFQVTYAKSSETETRSHSDRLSFTRKFLSDPFRPLDDFLDVSCTSDEYCITRYSNRGRASWASFAHVALKTCSASLCYEVIEGHADRCPSDLTTVPMQVSLRDVIAIGIMSGMRVDSAIPQSNWISMSGAIGSISSSTHAILGTLVHFEGAILEAEDQWQSLGKIEPMWLKRMQDIVPVAGASFGYYERRAFDLIEGVWIRASRRSGKSVVLSGAIPTAEDLAVPAKRRRTRPLDPKGRESFTSVIVNPEESQGTTKAKSVALKGFEPHGIHDGNWSFLHPVVSQKKESAKGVVNSGSPESEDENLHFRTAYAKDSNMLASSEYRIVQPSEKNDPKQSTAPQYKEEQRTSATLEQANSAEGQQLHLILSASRPENSRGRYSNDSNQTNLEPNGRSSRPESDTKERNAENAENGEDEETEEDEESEADEEEQSPYIPVRTIDRYTPGPPPGMFSWIWISQMDTMVGYCATPHANLQQRNFPIVLISVVLEALLEFTTEKSLIYRDLKTYSKDLPGVTSWMDSKRCTWPSYAINARGGVVIDGSYTTAEFSGFQYPLPRIELLGSYDHHTSLNVPRNIDSDRHKVAELMMLDSWLSLCGRNPEIFDGKSDLLRSTPALMSRIIDTFANVFLSINISSVDGGSQQVKEVKHQLMKWLDYEKLSEAEQLFALVALLRSAKACLRMTLGPSTRNIQELLDHDTRVWMA